MGEYDYSVMTMVAILEGNDSIRFTGLAIYTQSLIFPEKPLNKRKPDPANHGPQTDGYKQTHGTGGIIMPVYPGKDQGADKKDS